MRLGLPSGHIDQHVIDMIDTILEANTPLRISRQDRIRGFIAIPKEATSNVLTSLQLAGLVAS